MVWRFRYTSHTAGFVKEDHAVVLLQVILKQMLDWTQGGNFSMIPDRVRPSSAIVLLLLIFLKEDMFQ